MPLEEHLQPKTIFSVYDLVKIDKECDSPLVISNRNIPFDYMVNII